MPVENLEEEGLAKNPNLNIAQTAFLLASDKQNSLLKQRLLTYIRKNGMYD